MTRLIEILLFRAILEAPPKSASQILLKPETGKETLPTTFIQLR